MLLKHNTVLVELKKCKKVISNIFLLTKLNWTQNQQLEKDWQLHFKEQCNIAVFRNVFIAQVDVAMTIKKWYIVQPYTAVPSDWSQQQITVVSKQFLPSCT